MLVITCRDKESFRVSHEGVEVWITLKKHNGKIRVYVDGPKALQVLRENLCESEPAASAEAPISEMCPAFAGAASDKSRRTDP